MMYYDVLWCIMMYYGSVFGAPWGPHWGPLEWVKSKKTVLRRVKSASGRPQLETPWAGAHQKKIEKSWKVTPKEVQMSPKNLIKKLNLFKLQGDTIYYKWLRLRATQPWHCRHPPPAKELRNCTGHNSGPRTWALVLGVVWKWSDYPLVN